MADDYDRILAAREDLAMLVSDLYSLSGQLEELATTVRRAGLSSMLELQPGFHMRLVDAAHRLTLTLHALADAGTDQPPGLAFSAIAQLSALENDISVVATATVPSDRFRADDDAGIPEMITGTLRRIRTRLWSLISHLARIKEWSLGGQPGAGAPGLAQECVQLTFG